MKNNNVLKVRELHNRGIDSKGCKFCAYNWENGCPSDQSSCWYCKDKSEFKIVPSLDSSSGSLSKSDLLNSLRFQVFSDVQHASWRLFSENFNALRELVVNVSCSEFHFKLPEGFSSFSDFLYNFSFDVECKVIVVDFDRNIGIEVNVPFIN